MAQSIASLLAVLIAISAALFAIERERFERRSRQYRNELKNLKENYGNHLDTLSIILDFQGAGRMHLLSGDDLSNEDELEEKIREQNGLYYPTSLYAAHISRVTQGLRKIKPEDDYLLKQSELEDIQNSVSWLKKHTHGLTATAKEFITYMAETDVSEEDMATEQIFFYENMTSEMREDIMKMGREKKDVTHPDDSTLSNYDEEAVTGNNYKSFAILIDSLNQDLRSAVSESKGSIGDTPSSSFREVAILSTYLMVLGVIIPISFLASIPPSFQILTFTEVQIEYVQIVLLIGTISLLFVLVDIIYKSTRPMSDFGDISALNWVSKLILFILPRTKYPSRATVEDRVHRVKQRFEEEEEHPLDH